MSVGGGKYTLEKTWKAAAPAVSTFNNPTSFTFPYGRYEALVSGRGQPGNPNIPSYANYNPGSGGNPNFGPGSGGNYAGQYVEPGYTSYFPRYNVYESVYNPVTGMNFYFYNGIENQCPSPYQIYQPAYGLYDDITYSCGYAPPGSTTNPPTPVPYYNPYYPGPVIGYNPYYPGNISGYNPAASGNPGNPATAFGVTFPGGATATPGTYVAPTRVDRYAYPDTSTTNLTIPPGAYVTLDYS